MISLPNNWLTVTAALTQEEKGRLVDALAVLSSGGDPETVATGAERVLLPMLAEMQKKSKSGKGKECQKVNSDSFDSSDSQEISKGEQGKSKSGTETVKRQEERDERKKKESSKERRKREEREEESVSSPPRLTTDLLTDYLPEDRAREDAAEGGDSVSQSVTSQLVEIWNTIPGLTKIRLTPRRVQQVDDLRIWFTDQELLTGFAGIREKPFLLGQNERKWVAMWNWVVTPANFSRLLDGDFDPPAARQASYDIDRAMDRMRTTVPALTKRRR